MTVLYGSSVADATLTAACDMASASGGVETSKTTTLTGSGNFGEITSQGSSVAAVAAIPATPTGKGWVFQPGVGSFATGNWSAIATVSAAGWGGGPTSTKITIRFFKYSGGSYTSIGSLAAVGITATAKTTYTFTAVSMSSVSFGASDLVYVDLWWQDNTGAPGDNPVVYESTSAATGVANDMQVTTSAFTATNIRTITSTAALLQTSTRTITSTAALLQTNKRTITSTAALLQTNTRTITSTAALLQTSTRTITSTASLATGATTSTRTIPSTAALLQTSTRTITSTAALLQTNTRTITSSAALLQIGTRTITSTVALLQTTARPITSTAALLQTNKRTVSSTAALLQTNKRTIPSSVSLGSSRVIPSTAALLQTLSRVIFSSASLASGTVAPVVYAKLLYLQTAQLITASGNSGPLTVGYLGEISLDINITSNQGASPTIQFFIDRLGTDGVYYPIYDSTSISAAPMVKSASTGAGLGSAASFAGTIQVRWAIGGSSSPGWIYSLSLVGK